MADRTCSRAVMSTEITGSTSSSAKKTFVGAEGKAMSGASRTAIHTSSEIATPSRSPDVRLTVVRAGLE